MDVALSLRGGRARGCCSLSLWRGGGHAEVFCSLGRERTCRCCSFLSKSGHTDVDVALVLDWGRTPRFALCSGREADTYMLFSLSLSFSPRASEHAWNAWIFKWYQYTVEERKGAQAAPRFHIARRSGNGEGRLVSLGVFRLFCSISARLVLYTEFWYFLCLSFADLVPGIWYVFFVWFGSVWFGLVWFGSIGCVLCRSRVFDRLFFVAEKKS